MAVKIVIAMLIVQLIDNNVFQPLIQGKSVKAHPVEIFLVVIAAASLGGIPAMIVAVPTYGFLKIVATEFLSHFRGMHEMKS
jgi:predicted PurR-regulated permease PerM